MKMKNCTIRNFIICTLHRREVKPKNNNAAWYEANLVVNGR
jgi:hypothetical protein